VRIAERVKPLYPNIERAARRAQSTDWRLACCPAHDSAQAFVGDG